MFKAAKYEEIAVGIETIKRKEKIYIAFHLDDPHEIVCIDLEEQ